MAYRGVAPWGVRGYLASNILVFILKIWSRSKLYRTAAQERMPMYRLAVLGVAQLFQHFRQRTNRGLLHDPVRSTGGEGVFTLPIFWKFCSLLILEILICFLENFFETLS